MQPPHPRALLKALGWHFSFSGLLLVPLGAPCRRGGRCPLPMTKRAVGPLCWLCEAIAPGQPEALPKPAVTPTGQQQSGEHRRWAISSGWVQPALTSPSQLQLASTSLAPERDLACPCWVCSRPTVYFLSGNILNVLHVLSKYEQAHKQLNLLTTTLIHPGVYPSGCSPIHTVMS